MPAIVLIILFPLVVSLLLLFLPRGKGQLKGRLTLAVSLLLMPGALKAFLDAPSSWQVIFPSNYPQLLHTFSNFLVFNVDGAGSLMVLLLGIMLPILITGAIAIEKKQASDNHYFSWVMVSAGLCFAILTAGHLYMLIFLWGLLGIPLYLLASGYDESRASLGKKTLVLFGGAHGLMTTGAVIAVALSGTGYLTEIELSTITTINNLAFLALLSGGLAVAGIFPFQSWVIDFGEFSPGRISALMPVIILRFAGVYLLIRLIHDLFILSESMRIVLFSLASITIILGILMSFNGSHAAKRLAYVHVATGGLALLAVSTGTLAGLKAAIVYVLAPGAAIAAMFLVLERNSLQNNSVSQKLLSKTNITNKSFFSSTSFLLVSLAGLPPFGMFAANSLLFKGLWEFTNGSSLTHMLSILWVVIAIAAVGGLFAVVLLIRPYMLASANEREIKLTSGNLSFKISMLFFALVAVLSGLFLFGLPVDRISGNFTAKASLVWESKYVLLVAVCMLLSLILGVGAFRLLQKNGSRFFKIPYLLEKSNFTDIYFVFSKLVFSINRPLSRMHDGVLQTYLVWITAALIILFLLNI